MGSATPRLLTRHHKLKRHVVILARATGKGKIVDASVRRPLPIFVDDLHSRVGQCKMYLWCVTRGMVEMIVIKQVIEKRSM